MELHPVAPFEPVLTDTFPVGANWTSQIKWDGVRMLAYYDGDQTKLINRKLNERTRQYPEFAHAPDYVEATSVILDGEFIAMNQSRPSFHEIMRRDGLRREEGILRAASVIPVTYMVFDILFCNGEWVTGLPLRERQALLAQVIRQGTNIQAVGDGGAPEALFNVMRTHSMEGVVCKDLESVYVPGGKDKRWRKMKVIHDLNAVVGGVTYRDGIVNALLLGLYNDRGELIYIGHAGAGKLTYADYRELTAEVPSICISERPFQGRVEREKESHWIKPGTRAVKVNYLEWTEGGTLRQPVLQAFIDPLQSDCTFDQLT